MKKLLLLSFWSVLFCGSVLAAPYVADSSTLALWHMNEGAGSTILDDSGNGNSGTLVGADISWTTGKYDGGIQMTALNNSTGRGSKITLPANLLSRRDFTVQMNLNWDYLAQFPIPGDNLAGYLFSGGSTNTFARSKFDSSNPALNKCALVFGIFVDNGSGGFNVLTATTPSEYALNGNEWTNVAFTSSWEDSGGGIFNSFARIFVNGELAAEASNAGAPLASNGTPYMGRTDSSASWGGQIDEVRVLNYAIPEPATMILLGLGSLMTLRRSKK